jgi:hypothetical protein
LKDPGNSKIRLRGALQDHPRDVCTKFHQDPLKTAAEDVFFVPKLMLDDGLLAAILEKSGNSNSRICGALRDHPRYVCTKFHQDPLKIAAEDVLFVPKLMLDDGLLAAILEKSGNSKIWVCGALRDHPRYVCTKFHQDPLKTAAEDVFFVSKWTPDA